MTGLLGFRFLCFISCFGQGKNTFTVIEESFVHTTYRRHIIIVTDVMLSTIVIFLRHPTWLSSNRYNLLIWFPLCICLPNASILQHICFVWYNIKPFWEEFIGNWSFTNSKAFLLILKYQTSNLYLSFEGIVALQILELNVKTLEIYTTAIFRLFVKTIVLWLELWSFPNT